MSFERFEYQYFALLGLTKDFFFFFLKELVGSERFLL